MALTILVLTVYGQVDGHSFMNLDDSQYILENRHVSSGVSPENVRWAFSAFDAANWHPLTWLSHMLDVSLFGLDAGKHHLVNVLFHLFNTLLLFHLLRRMTGENRKSGLVAALFAVHPLHVESVAWIAERKDVLSTFFGMLTLSAYARYCEYPGVRRYAVVVACFALGLMAKPMLVTLPFVLLLLDYWPLGRFGAFEQPGETPGRASWARPMRLVLEKLPLLALSTVSCMITVLAQTRGGAVDTLGNLPFAWRVGNAFLSYAAYLAKTAWPSALAVFYPHRRSVHGGFSTWEVAGSVLLVVGLSLLAVHQRRRRPFFTVGWLWYLGTLVPVIGLVQVGQAARADRYTYVPLIGVFLALAWSIFGAVARRFRPLAAAALGGALLALATVSWIQIGYWRNSVALFSRALEVTDNNWFAWNNLGVAYAGLGQTGKAIFSFQRAMQLKPGNGVVWRNLGEAYEILGQAEQAKAYFRGALEIMPGDARARNGLGAAYARLGRLDEAVASYKEALRIQPDFVEAWYNLGAALDRIGSSREAISSYGEALRFKPDYADAWRGIGLAYGRARELPRAVASFREALRIRPDDANAWSSLALAYDKLGERRQAEECYLQARRFKAN